MLAETLGLGDMDGVLVIEDPGETEAEAETEVLGDTLTDGVTDTDDDALGVGGTELDGVADEELVGEGSGDSLDTKDSDGAADSLGSGLTLTPAVADGDGTGDVTCATVGAGVTAVLFCWRTTTLMGAAAAKAKIARKTNTVRTIADGCGDGALSWGKEMFK